MADNWSASVTTLSGPGDYIEWSVDVPDDTTRDALNCGGAGINQRLRLRYGATVSAFGTQYVMFQVNDSAARVLIDGLTERITTNPATWVSADRFETFDATSYGWKISCLRDPSVQAQNGRPSNAGVAYYPSGIAPSGPWVTGTNKLRLIHGGGNGGSAVAFEVDFVEIDAGPSVGFNTFGGDTNDVAESKPGDFDSHVDWDPFVGWHSFPAVLLKAPDGTTGHAALADITSSYPPVGVELDHLLGITIVSDETSDPATGTVFVEDLGGGFTTTPYTLDGSGSCVVNVPNSNCVVYYGGDDLVAPDYVPYLWSSTIPFLTHDFGDGLGEVRAHHHDNGGGWVSDDADTFATADATCYIAADSGGICHGARLTDHAQVLDSAEVIGGTMQDSAILGGNARLNFGFMSGNGRAYDDATVGGSVVESGRVYEHGTINSGGTVSGRGRVYGYAVVNDAATVTDSARLYDAASIEGTFS